MDSYKKIFDILPEDYTVKKLNTKPFAFLEGPVWDKKDTLYFSDVSGCKTYKMSAEGKFGVVRENTMHGNGQVLDKNGNILTCEMSEGRIVKVSPVTGEVLGIVVDTYKGKRFNATNDLVFDGRGGLYFTDPYFDVGPRDQDVEASYYLNLYGEVFCVAQDSSKPNGLVLSPDGKVLYINDTVNVTVWAYDVNKDGSLSKGRKFCEVIPPDHLKIKNPLQAAGEADGMDVDSGGNLYITTFSGIQVFSNSGEYIGLIQMPGDESPANCTFGGEDMKTLFLTARTSLYSVELLMPGIK